MQGIEPLQDASSAAKLITTGRGEDMMDFTPLNPSFR
jgi:hypothetical protein